LEDFFFMRTKNSCLLYLYAHNKTEIKPVLIMPKDQISPAKAPDGSPVSLKEWAVPPMEGRR
jgi:hypothetical protein